MSRHARLRWVVIVEQEDGTSACYGPWRSSDRAYEIADGLRARSSRYVANDELPYLEVSVELLEPWLGYEVASGVKRA